MVIKMAPPLIVLIAASPTYPPRAAAVAVLPPGRAMNNAITTVIVTANVRPVTTCNAGPRNQGRHPRRRSGREVFWAAPRGLMGPDLLLRVSAADRSGPR